jgi:hypothetical protein
MTRLPLGFESAQVKNLFTHESSAAHQLRKLDIPIGSMASLTIVFMDTLNAEREEAFSFWKNLILTTLFFTITPLVLGISLFSLIFLSKPSPQTGDGMYTAVTPGANLSQSGVRIFASLPAKIPTIDGFATGSDARVEIIKQYLENYSSPLAPFSAHIVAAADKYNLDFRLIPAIAQKESNLCKIIPPDSHNCWGWGIYTNSNVGFESYESAIDTVSRGLKENYLNDGLITPEQIMARYTPASNGSWAEDVTRFMNEME